jgi:transposase
MTRAEGFVGIDVSKARLDVALGDAGELFSADNDAHGIAELVTRLRRVAPELIVLEASGGLETGLVGELAAAQLPVAVVNPRQVRDTRHRAVGQDRRTRRPSAGFVCRADATATAHAAG